MTIQLHAQPYDISAVGFYFDSFEDYAEKASNLRNDYGDPVEEFRMPLWLLTLPELRDNRRVRAMMDHVAEWFAG